MTEVHASFQKLFHRNRDRQVNPPLRFDFKNKRQERNAPVSTQVLKQNQTIGSAFGELEAGTRALLSVFLPFFHTRVARQQTRLFQTLAQLEVVDLQRAGNAVANGA